jgi:pimeloyl-ACP methyl ester carboxylesterase
MKNITFLCFAFLIFFYACKKDKNQDISNPNPRGSVIGEPTTLNTYPKAFIALALSTILGNNAPAVQLTYDVELIKIDYNTIDPAGNPTEASGLLILPVNATAALPLLSYQHGTILSKLNAPSKLQGGYEVGLVFGSEGYAVACPDFLGLGDGSKLHPYLHAKSEATAVIDMLRAVRSVCKGKNVVLNDQLFLMGYSQGGHVTMAALKAIEEEYSSEFSVTACAPMAAPYDLSGTQLNYMLRDSAYPDPAYLPYLLFAYNNVYNIYPDLSSAFAAPYYDNFKDYFGDNPTSELSVVDKLWPSSMIPIAVLDPVLVQGLKQNQNDPLKLALKENDLYDWAPKSPLHICHCDSDKHVPFQNSTIAYNSFISNGSSGVQLIMPLHGGTHITCATPSFIHALTWFHSLKK